MKRAEQDALVVRALHLPGDGLEVCGADLEDGEREQLGARVAVRELGGLVRIDDAARLRIDHEQDVPRVLEQERRDLWIVARRHVRRANLPEAAVPDMLVIRGGQPSSQKW